MVVVYNLKRAATKYAAVGRGRGTRPIWYVFQTRIKRVELFVSFQIGSCKIYTRSCFRVAAGKRQTRRPSLMCTSLKMSMV